ncbi:MAG TPA: carboxymuconolactone decarboxylase family protein [Polyangiaceae bacterium]|jgi:AhpD family alkylhydroperoxidase
MQARLKNPAVLLPDLMPPFQALNAVIEKSGLPPKTAGLAHLRASQINGCAVCIDMHVRMGKKHGETEERLMTVSAWREAPYFTEAERAALALTEAVTRLADRPDPVPDDVWNEAAKHFDEKALAGLVTQIALVNVYNRMNVATRQIAGKQSW